MKFGVIINEAYTPEMKKVLGSYLTDIGNALAKKNVSVQNLNFVDVGLSKPVAFNSVFRYLNDGSAGASWYRNYQVALGSNKPGNSSLNYVICIFKHANGGVSVCVTDITRYYDVKRPEDTRILTFGNAEGKVTVAFIAGLTENERDSLSVLRNRRSDLNKPAQDPHDVSRRIHRKLSYMDNPNLKAISDWASKLGFKDFRPFTSCEDGSYYIMGSGGTNMNLPTRSSAWGKIFSIKPGYRVEYEPHKGDERVGYILDIDISILELNLNKGNMSFKELENKLKVLDDFKDACLRVKEFVDFINDFTYDDLVWNR